MRIAVCAVNERDREQVFPKLQRAMERQMERQEAAADAEARCAWDERRLAAVRGRG